MPAVARKSDICTGHGTFPPRPSVEGSLNVNIEGLPALRLGDAWAVHCNPVPICHSGSQGAGSGTVFVNGKPLARVGDAVSCGGSVATGAATVNAGG